MGLIKSLRVAETTEDFEALEKERLLLKNAVTVFSNIFSPEVLRACLRYIVEKKGPLDDVKIRRAFYIVTDHYRVDLIDVFFTEGLVTTESLVFTDGFRVYISFVIQEGSVDVLNFFLEKGLDPDTIGFWNQSLLYEACFYKKIDIVRLLLENGAHVNLENNDGCVALFAVLESLHTLDLLIVHGANIYHRDLNGNTVWDYFSWHSLRSEDALDVCRRLIDFKAPLRRKTYLRIEQTLASPKSILTMLQEFVDKQGCFEEAMD